MTRLADEFVADYKRRFPFTVMYTGLPLEIQSDIDINSPRDLTHWRHFVRSIEVQLDRIPEAELVGRPEWITRVYLSQGIAEAHTAEVCRMPWARDSTPVNIIKCCSRRGRYRFRL